MGTRYKIYIAVLIVYAIFHITDGCSISGIPSWVIPQTTSILDIHRGDIFRGATTNVLGLDTVVFSEGLNHGPYMDVLLEDSTFVIKTNENYILYEELEVLNFMSVTVTFLCSDNSQQLTFIVTVIDTNNNYPNFIPNNNYEFEVIPPLPPGYQITNAINAIQVRDIDLTTRSIIFEIVNSTDFEIDYDGPSTTAKEFRAVLRTTTFIRNIPEPYTLTIKATDVDDTNDPPLSTYATVRISSSDEFVFPDELVFTQTFYMAEYNRANEINLNEQISLRQGFHEDVQFSLVQTDEYTQHFEISSEGNSVILQVVKPIPEEVFSQHKLFLVVRADRELTTGTSTTVIVQLPEARYLGFTENTYKGTIQEDKTLSLGPFILNSGYEDDVNFNILGDYSEFFSTSNIDNEIQIELLPSLPDSAISENNYLLIILEASAPHAVSAYANIILEILKEDVTTPQFSQNIYTGTYTNFNLDNIDTITLTQGYDSTVNFSLIGAHHEYFILSPAVSGVTLTIISPIPEEIIFNEKVLLLNVVAAKPLTVGASAVVSVNFDSELTEPVVLAFAQNTYTGFLNQTTLDLDNIVLDSGFGPGTEFIFSGQYSDYFTFTNNSNVLDISPTNALPQYIFNQKFIVLGIEAKRIRAVSAYTTIIIEIEEPEIIEPPVFHENFYTGVYTIENGLRIEKQINLYGYDESVSFSLEGEFSQWFTVTPNVNPPTITITYIPEDVLESNSHLVFTIVALKPGVVNGYASVVIDLPKETPEVVVLRFTEPSYIGQIENNVLNLAPVLLDGDYDMAVELIPTGEYASYFSVTRQSHVINIELIDDLPEQIIDDNTFISFNIRASYPEAFNGDTTIVLELIREPDKYIVTPVFSQAHYKGQYSEKDGLIFENDIELIQGFDDTVDIDIVGDDAKYFILVENEQNRLNLSVIDTSIDDINDRSYLIFNVVASKEGSVPGAATIIISLQASEIDPPIFFNEVLYEGKVQSGAVQHETIILNGYEGNNVALVGEYSAAFRATHSDGVVIVETVDSLNLPSNVQHIILELQAASARAVLFLEVPAVETITEYFNKAIYEGKIENGIIHHETITLIGFEGTDIEITGEYSAMFRATHTDGTVVVDAENLATLPPNTQLIVLELRAGNAVTMLLLQITESATNPTIFFDKLVYEGKIENGAVQHETITLNGYEDATVVVVVAGEYSGLFQATYVAGVVTVEPVGSLALPPNTPHVLLELRTADASSVLLLEVIASEIDPSIFFNKVLYDGKVQSGVVQHETIILNGYEGNNVALVGEYSAAFRATHSDGVVIVETVDSLNLPSNVQHIILELQAASARAVLFLDIPAVETITEYFDKTIYEGKIENGIIHHETITLIGFEGTDIEITGEHSAVFRATYTDGTVFVDAENLATLPPNTQLIVLELRAGNAVTMLLLQITESATNPTIFFDKLVYEGKIENGAIQHETITLNGYEDATVVVIVAGEHSGLFQATYVAGVVTVEPVGSLALPPNTPHVLLELRTADASSVLLLEVIASEIDPSIFFNKVLYDGKVQSGVVQHETIILNGYEGNNVALVGEYSAAFRATHSDGVVIVETVDSLNLPSNVQHIILELQAASARAVLFLEIPAVETITEYFDKTIYEGKIENGIIHHETITLIGFEGTDIEITGEHSAVFRATYTDGTVFVDAENLATLPPITQLIGLELRAGNAVTMLLLQITDSETNPTIFFDKVLYEGKIENGAVHHETITLNGYEDATVVVIVAGEHSGLFHATYVAGVVTVEPVASLALPPNTPHVLLELRTADASSVLLLEVIASEIDPSIFFNKVLYDGKVQSGVVQHETIILNGYEGNNVALVGEYSAAFRATHSDGVVIVETVDSLNLPSNVQHIILELQAASARAVLFLEIPAVETITEYFDKTIYEGKIENGIIHHETITLIGFEGTDIEITGEHSAVFRATYTDGTVFVDAENLATLPPNTQLIVLELRAGNAVTMLLLQITESATNPTIFFDKLVYEGKIENGAIQHETITLNGYEDATVVVIVAGEHSGLFQATYVAGVVTVEPVASLALPPNTPHVLLELRTADASSVLLLEVIASEIDPSIFFNKVLYDGKVQSGVVQHETIILNGYEGNNVALVGEYSAAFRATHSDGVVIVETVDSLNLPSNVQHIILELQAASARAVLFLEIPAVETITEYFDKTIYEGKIENGIIHHETITLIGFEGTDIVITGEHSAVFRATYTEGTVFVDAENLATLPPNTQLIVLELRAGNAVTMLLLQITESATNPTIFFDKLVYEGKIENGAVQHETITLNGYEDATVVVIVAGEHSGLFQATYVAGVVTVEPVGSLALPPNTPHVLLELRTADASSVLLLEVIASEIDPSIFFNKVLYDGKVQSGVVQHETIILNGYEGNNVALVGEYSAAFRATHSDGVVIVETVDSLNLPSNVQHIILELQAASARAVLFLEIPAVETITEYFDKTIYEGKIENGIIHHETITLIGFEGTDIEITGEHSAVFRATYTDGTVFVDAENLATLPPNTQLIVLELRAGNAVTMLLLQITESATNPTIFFDKLVYEGKIENGAVQHETITLNGYEDATVVVIVAGEHSGLFQATYVAGVVTVEPVGSLALPPNTPHVLLELRTADASSVLLLEVIASEIDPSIFFNKVLYDGKVQSGVVQHETIILNGYEGNNVALVGEYSAAFRATHSDGVVIVETVDSLNLPSNVQHIILELQAASARAVLFLEIPAVETITEYFDKTIYEGKIENGIIHHETITLIGFEGTDIVITGEHSAVFRATYTEGTVFVDAENLATLPPNTQLIVLELRAGNAVTMLLLQITESATNPTIFFDKLVYEGKIENGAVQHETITLNGYEDATVVVIVAGEHSGLFQATYVAGVVTVEPVGSLALPPNTPHVLLELRTADASSVLLLEVIASEIDPSIFFNKVLYDGKVQSGVVQHETIILNGYEGNNVALVGEYSAAFRATHSDGVVIVETVDSLNLPSNVQHIILELQAASARAVLFLEIPAVETITEYFDKTIYEGKIENGIIHHETITLIGFEGTDIEITGEHSAVFRATYTDGTVFVDAENLATLPPNTQLIVLELRAGNAVTMLLLQITESATNPTIFFDKLVYEGKIENGAIQHETITLNGYEDATVVVIVAGEHSGLFQATYVAGVVTVEPVGSLALPPNTPHVLLELRTADASSVLLLEVIASEIDPSIFFNKVLYDGKVQSGVVQHETIILNGYEGNNVALVGEYSAAFRATHSDGVVIVETVDSLNLPSNVQHIILELQAATARAVLFLEIPAVETITEYFDKAIYEGKIENGIIHHETITLIGFEGTDIEITGEHSAVFRATYTDGTVFVDAENLATIPPNTQLIVLELRAGNAVTMLLLQITDSETNPTIFFDKVLYNGKIENGAVHHETITLNGYDDTTVFIVAGEYGGLFQATHLDGVVSVEPIGSLVLPPNTQHVLLQISTATARAVLLLEIIEIPVMPIVSFETPSYVIRVDIDQSGTVGRVQALADNGETVTYSLVFDNDHLQARLSINNNGELYLSAPADIGTYDFQVIATTIITEATGSAMVHLTVEEIATCGEKYAVTAPLIITDRDEEQPLRDLVVLDPVLHAGCKYIIANTWPTEQDWLYVDDTGLHALAIDREHPSISFMALSQIQAELILECNNETERIKRSLDSRQNSLGPYDYGSNTWIIANTIDYNPRRTIVNLIVNDINDNTPIFIGKENEPIVVGYPVSDLQPIILPRSLIELQATDADVGENAALRYWSSETQLAVSAATGFVHVKNDAALSNNMQLIISATDRNGLGFTGTISLTLKTLDSNNIVVLSIRNAFLENESQILQNISNTIGYEVKLLRSAIVPNTFEAQIRKKRNVGAADGGTLEMYIYGIIEREPVSVERLTTDIVDSSAALPLDIANILSLDTHLEAQSTTSSQNTGLLAATIVLSILLFVIIVVALGWFIWKRKWSRPYSQFRDSDTSINPSVVSDDIDKQTVAEATTKPRLNIDELKRSEKRLQEMLNAPREEVTVKPSVMAINPETVVSIPDTMVAPIIIQDKLKDGENSDDEDEFGEKKTRARRKSVVTFNENVEKIITVEDIPGEQEDNDSIIEFYRL